MTRIEKKKLDELSNLHVNLKLLHYQLRDKKKIEWDRVLPFDELLFDRSEKANYVKAKKGASVYENSYLYGNVMIGKNTWVGPYTLLDGSGGKLKIGDFCSISGGVHIYTHNTVERSLTAGKASHKKGAVTIGDCCFLGPYVVVSLGTRIGRCSVIGAHSFVNSNIPPYSIAYGMPAKVVGKISIKGKNIKYHLFNKQKKKE